ncbi:hypothetical protein CAEBREN_12356 [Caenorhabditis brenneri]|uniref:Uncharacterized protein n=1 Tax=Caenorhabditis brenneri TaxID=135651 RepID=G0ND94_CAEBE|nr:hypothetical protein CAEBREN_12356 [Caenorhabditis brenneri]
MGCFVNIRTPKKQNKSGSDLKPGYSLAFSEQVFLGTNTRLRNKFRLSPTGILAGQGKETIIMGRTLKYISLNGNVLVNSVFKYGKRLFHISLHSQKDADTTKMMMTVKVTNSNFYEQERKM